MLTLPCLRIKDAEGSRASNVKQPRVDAPRQFGEHASDRVVRSPRSWLQSVQESTPTVPALGHLRVERAVRPQANSLHLQAFCSSNGTRCDLSQVMVDVPANNGRSRARCHLSLILKTGISRCAARAWGSKREVVFSDNSLRISAAMRSASALNPLLRLIFLHFLRQLECGLNQLIDRV